MKIGGEVVSGFGNAHETLLLQAPFFCKRGLDISGFFPGTINLSLTNFGVKIKKLDFFFSDLHWTPRDPGFVESFGFIKIEDLFADGVKQSCKSLLYFPFKSRHFREKDSFDLLEVLCEKKLVKPRLVELVISDEKLAKVSHNQ